MHKHTLA